MLRKIKYRDAIKEALFEEMARDERVFIMGIGVAKRGGSFGVTKGLLDAFGSERVISSPSVRSSVLLQSLICGDVISCQGFETLVHVSASLARDDRQACRCG